MYRLNYFTLSFLLGGIACYFTGILAYFKNKKGSANRYFCILSLCSGIWSIGHFVMGATYSYRLALASCRILYAMAILIPPIYMKLIFTLIEEAEKRKKEIFLSFLVSFVFLLSLFNKSFIQSIVPKMMFGYYDQLGFLGIFFALFFGFVPTYAAGRLFFALKKYKGFKLMQLKYVLLGSTFGFIGGGSTFLLAFGIPLPPYPIALFVFYPIIVNYAIIKYRFMDIRIALTRGSIFVFVYFFVAVIPFWIAPQFIHTKLWWVPIMLMGLLATAGPIIYRCLKQKAEDVLLAQQRRYQKLLLEAARGMVREHNLDRLLKLIVYVTKRVVKVEFAAVFLGDKEDNRYKLKAIRDHNAITQDTVFPYNHPLISLIRQKKELLVYEEINPSLQQSLTTPVHLIIPSFIDNELLGFVVLGEKKDRTFYTQDDINVFTILSRQAALAISHCLFLEESKQAQEKIFQAEKLASIGGMADGVAHQIRNRLNHFSVAAGEQKFEIEDFMNAHPDVMKQNPDLEKSLQYLKQTADSIVTNVKKTAGVIQGILNFARVEEKETFYSHFSLNEVLTIAIDLLKVKHQAAQFPLTTQVNGDDTLYGVKSQIMESLYNIIDNGYEAIQEKMNYYLNEEEKRTFKPSITLRLFQNEKYSRIEISDNGSGIKNENKKKVFAPFFTTKSSYTSGTGIGMYVVKRMIEENHQGRIWFDSIPMRGTTFTIELPKQ